MKNLTPREIAILVVLVLAMIAAFSVAKEHPTPTDSDEPFGLIEAGNAKPAPDFTLNTPDGKTVTLSEAVSHGPVVIDFWATWCGPCRMEMPMVDSINQGYASRGVQVYGINSDASADEVKHFFAQQHVGFPILLDTGGSVASEYGVSGLPTIAVIDTKERVRAVDVGFDPETNSDLSNCLDSLLKEE
jgi:peroxiredoxin